jgi:hypothetical protein
MDWQSTIYQLLEKKIRRKNSTTAIIKALFCTSFLRWFAPSCFYPFFSLALYGVVFPNEAAAAFSNYRLWESLGFVVAYIYGNRICVDAKLWVISAFLFLGMVGYLIVEWLIRKNPPEPEKEKNDTSEKS